MNTKNILDKLPYASPFLFVDQLETVSETGVTGSFTFLPDADFYKGHFKDFPVTPGVILTECCAQIGVVCLGIYLMGDELGQNIKIGFSNSSMEFLEPVYPNEKVTVKSEKIYFRFNKLKCKVKMFNSTGKLVCRGELSGMFKNDSDAK
ncbi:MAG: hydroxymyristoyl-ACP dehydratase [Croceitalea sp.]|nr:hydroxymyristoyl-ACP dehydratase [Croceitalea sp.]NNC34865.1 hydroxymyristoyl-ACP dehydratase [Croceitalea sp.]